MSSFTVEESATLTDSPLYRLKHKWTVKDFASAYLVKSTTEKENYPQLNSAWFSSSLDCQLEFRLKLWPRGHNKYCADDLGLYLEMKGSPLSPLAKSADVKYKCSLLNERNEECHSREVRREFDYPSDSSGTYSFLKQSQLKEPANGLLPGDTLTILAEVAVFPTPVSHHGDALLAKLKVESLESVRASLGGLLDSAEHSDVLLVVEGSEIPAHKNLLSAHSPVFSDMFKSEMAQEKDDGKVRIPELKVVIARAMLRFIYTGEVPDLMAEYAQELLVAADKYGVTHLKELCGAYLCGQVNPEKVTALLAFADRHSVPQLKSTCVEYIRSHWEEVMLTGDWNSVQDLFTQELRQLKLKEDEESAN